MELGIREKLPLSEIARNFNAYLMGTDRQISKFGNLSSVTDKPQQQLTYVIAEKYLKSFNTSNIGACIVHESLKELCIKEKSYIITSENPEQLFYTIFLNHYQSGHFKTLSSTRDSSTIIAPSAVIHNSVVIGKDCLIMDNVVIMPNTIIGDRVTIKPNTVIGGDGFQVKTLEGRRKVIPHVGGVKIMNDVEIGSSVCIDKGLFGEFTTIHNETKIDNLVHIAHSAVIGESCTIAAGSSIAGAVTVGNNVWIGVNCSINQLLNIGDYSLVGTGSVVIKSVLPHKKVFGSPAKTIGLVCKCRADIISSEEQLVCSQCNNRYAFVEGQLVEVS
ncbi:UDP-3-O-(3-hydroxymyristoyl)glucosamine N-acyltransferase [Paenibacillus ehimensis]|uniref:UDP-3-O-(3-hydroxymyristoyl)glucosamine N-acyltransferase n=1 Tax=Paenibacillus ehimensis TaxID=79264 RepID=A0ABT8VCV5_9BACL|nr:UDP-3-O-(3-hydroxymyristoyl)glucosamine N-acyltransferase [Paenibacillus ehimensis]MDO3678807.1 UDP-3-O-(3-hydroxymyristoyl)glucosamine N-acyltransferase [Paenibacillus ehimensis]MEC0209446.1 UDP-3-O-(3-hydroxymyristoyl)glucosamine N-acyltransferase [Paenibacillus ehimensis]